MTNKLYYSWSQIEGACLDIVRQLAADNWKPDYIVGITRGGAVPAVLISQYTGIQMKPLEVSLRDNGDCTTDCGMAEDAFNRKQILVVDDINDSGATIAWIKDDWMQSTMPDHVSWETIFGSNVRFATVFTKASSKETVEYSVEEVKDSTWVVFPWEDFWRNDVRFNN